MKHRIGQPGLFGASFQTSIRGKGGTLDESGVTENEEYPKTFPGVLALDNIDFELESGEIHGMLGENGAGKSTLINVLGGIYIPDRGEIIINGQKTQINGVKDAQEAGIAVIHQELVLVPHMSIAENVFLGREIKSPAGLVDKKRMERESVEILKRVGLEISPSVPVRSLSVAQQQMVEIVKASSFKCKNPW